MEIISKLRIVHADPKAIQQTEYTGNLDWAKVVTKISIYEQSKETILDFSQRTLRLL